MGDAVPPILSEESPVFPYKPDRAVALLWGTLAIAREVLFLSTYWAAWQRSLSHSNTMIFEWLAEGGYWPGIVDIFLLLAFALWASSGLWQSRSWAFVVTAFLCARNVASQLGRHPSINAVAHYATPAYIAFFVYCGLRAVGTFGPRAVSA